MSHETYPDNEENPLDALKHLQTKKTEPVKRIGPKVAALEGEESPKSIVQRLIGIAKDNDFNGVGKLMLGTARDELKDNTVQMKDLVELFHQHAPEIFAEPKSSKLLHLHFPNVKVRKAIPAIPQLPQKSEE